MQRVNLGLVMLVIFLLGACTALVTKEVATPLIIPEARADGETQMWESMCVDYQDVGISKRDSFMANLDKQNNWNDVLKKFGNRGWEPAQFLSTGGQMMAICFKRPI